MYEDLDALRLGDSNEIQKVRLEFSCATAGLPPPKLCRFAASCLETIGMLKATGDVCSGMKTWDRMYSGNQ